jgi:predicted DNA binding CopG/RHH family protein
MSTQKLADKDLQAWDTEQLGAEEKYIKRSDRQSEQALDEQLNMQLISFRLHQGLLKDLKFIAKAHGIAYQPMIRDILSRFAKSEINKIIRDSNERKRLENEQAELAKSQKDKQQRVA